MRYRMLLVSMALGSALVFGAPMAAQAKICKVAVYRAPVEGRTSANRKINAERRAIIRWEARMLGKFGPAWSVWANATGRSHSCNRKGGFWHCVAFARPCRP
ncbi:MAG: hypothetical protein ACE5FS_02595 [Paracoccaceae bacterium]